MSKRSKRHSKAGIEIFRAQTQARRAARSGEHDAADQLARDAIRLAAQSRRLAAAASIGAITATRTLPVLLDPSGCSPGGQPNWWLNQQRLDRAGIRGEAAQRLMDQARAMYARSSGQRRP